MHFVGVALASGLVSGVVVAFLNDYLQGRRRAADRREARRNDSARIVGPALASLRDLGPEANIGVLRGNANAERALTEKWTAWLAASGELEVLGSTHPNTPVDTRCQSVIEKGMMLLAGVDSAIRSGDALDEREWNRLKGLHKDALGAARELVQDVLDQPA